MMSMSTEKSYWDKQKDSLKKIRSQLTSGNKPGSSDSRYNNPRDRRRQLNNYRSQFGRSSRTPPAQLPSLKTPPGHGQGTSPNLRRSNYGTVPPVRTAQRQPQRQWRRVWYPGRYRPSGYDSWGEDGESDDSEGDTYPPSNPYPRGPYPYNNPYPQNFPYPVYVQPHPMYYGQQPVPMVYAGPPVQEPLRKSKKQVRYRNTPIYIEDPRSRAPTGYRSSEPPHTSPQFGYISTQPFIHNPAYGPQYAFAPDPTLESRDSLTPDVTSLYVDELITECLTDELIPDVLIEVLSHGDSPYVPRNDPAVSACEFLLDVEVLRLVRDVVNETLNEISDNYLFHKAMLQDPLEDFLNQLVDEAVYEGATVAVREAISEEVNDHLRRATLMKVVDDLIHEHLQEHTPGVMRDAVFDVMVEDIIEQDYIVPEVQDVCVEVAMETLQHYDQKKRQQDLRQILKHTGDKLIDTFCLDYLLRLLARQNLPWSQSDKAERVLDRFMMEVLIGQYLNVQEKRAATIDNKALRRVHEKMVADVATDVLLGELCQSLDEDIADLDEYELGFDLPDSKARPRLPTRLNQWIQGL